MAPHAIVRHPVYASYLLIQVGYVLQSLSWPNVAVSALTAARKAGRALAKQSLP